MPCLAVARVRLADEHDVHDAITPPLHDELAVAVVHTGHIDVDHVGIAVHHHSVVVIVIVVGDILLAVQQRGIPDHLVELAEVACVV